ncbi:hypothetical protein [Vibrio chagasii]|uniref:Uncharacterized protein n=1 Tax=Vibrio chagasii TaxID=170679 RepID=A0A7Y3YSQ1_9VIBR|nr:hypothetical protein [Vibrio chagasii]NOH36029.1 hypothetical protein [Vibrio chagasii]
MSGLNGIGGPGPSMNPMGMGLMGGAQNIQPQEAGMSQRGAAAPKEINYGGDEQMAGSAKGGGQSQGAGQGGSSLDKLIEQIIKNMMEEMQSKGPGQEGAQPGGGQGAGGIENKIKQVIQNLMGGLGN